MKALTVENVSFSYTDSPENSHTALNTINFAVQQGEYVALAGANGSGKSTLARLICGFLTPQNGSIHIHNDLNSACKSKTVPAGMIFQSPNNQLVANTVEHDTAFGPHNLRLCALEIKQRTEECLALTGLLEKSAHKTISLSAGQKQKLAFAGITALHPRLLVLDEPLSMIDVESRSALLAFIVAYHRAGNTVIHVTHAQDEIAQAERVLFLKNGNLIFDGNTAAFFATSYADLFSVPLPNSPPLPQHSVTPTTALAVSAISFLYDEQLFSNFTLAFQTGTLTALTGKSGSGKTTLMELACGLLKPQAGCIYAKNRPLFSPQENEAALFEEFAADDVAYGLIARDIHGTELTARTEHAMNAAGLPFAEFADRRTFSLSGGERRKLAFAGIISLDADVYFFDEPAAGLDGVSVATVLTILTDLVKKGKTVIFTTHRLEEAAIAHRVITLENGVIVNDTAPFVAEKTQNQREPLIEQKPLDGISVIGNLKNNASGSYCAANSLVHKLPAIEKYLFLLSFCLCGIVFNSFLLLGFLLCTEFVYAFFAKYPFSRLAHNCVKILPWIMVFFILQVLFFTAHPNDTVLASFWHITITVEKIQFAFKTLLHYCAVFVPLAVFMYTTDESGILDGMQTLVSPLAKLKIPVEHVVLVTGMLFRFVFLLAEEAAIILKAQLIRGGEKKRRGLFKNVRAVLPIFVPLILQTLKRAEALAEALDARYYFTKDTRN